MRVAQAGTGTSDQDLLVWMRYQRTRLKKGWMTRDQFDRLDALDGWKWDARPRSTVAVREYAQNLHGLGHGWTEIARQLNAAGHRTAGDKEFTTQSARALVLGSQTATDGTVNETRWHASYNQLHQWTETVRPLQRRNDGMEPELTRWMTRQREMRKQNRLSPERAALLEQLPGWVWLSKPHRAVA